MKLKLQSVQPLYANHVKQSLGHTDKFLSAETQISIFSMSTQQVKEWDLIMEDLRIWRWQTGEARRARKVKRARELHQNTWKKSFSLVSEFLQTSYAQPALFTVVICPAEKSRVGWDVNWSWAILLPSEKFLWLSSSIKGFIGVKQWSGGSSWQDFAKISICFSVPKCRKASLDVSVVCHSRPWENAQ